MTRATNVWAEHSEAVPSITISPARRLYWSVRRELWENRSIYLAPPAVAAVFLVGFFVSLIGTPRSQLYSIQPYVLAAMMLMLVDLLVALFYCLDALYGERRDRSILFWKSMPVSDGLTVIAKASIPILVLPLVTFVVTLATFLIMLLMSSVALVAGGVSAAPLWSQVPLLKTSLIHFVHLVGYHGIGYAPFYGWLLLASAWANRAPFLWAVLPPVAIAVLEKITFNTGYFVDMVQHRFMGGPLTAESEGEMTMEMFAPPPLGHFLTTPGLWVGVALTAVFLFAVVRLYRTRGPI